MSTEVMQLEHPHRSLLSSVIDCVSFSVLFLQVICRKVDETSRLYGFGLQVTYDGDTERNSFSVGLDMSISIGEYLNEIDVFEIQKKVHGLLSSFASRLQTSCLYVGTPHVCQYIFFSPTGTVVFVAGLHTTIRLRWLDTVLDCACLFFYR